MNINELKYFIKVADQQSLSKAANELYISYQGLSKSIKSLETELNCSLFEKSGNGYKLTESGEELYHTAKADRQRMGSASAFLTPDPAAPESFFSYRRRNGRRHAVCQFPQSA